MAHMYDMLFNKVIGQQPDADGKLEGVTIGVTKKEDINKIRSSFHRLKKQYTSMETDLNFQLLPRGDGDLTFVFTPSEKSPDTVFNVSYKFHKTTAPFTIVDESEIDMLLGTGENGEEDIEIVSDPEPTNPEDIITLHGGKHGT